MKPPPMNMPAMASRMPRTRPVGKPEHCPTLAPTQTPVESKMNME